MILKIKSYEGVMVKLRSYQHDAIDAIKKTFKNQNKQYVEMPTGSGKTITFLSYAKENHHSILIVVPSKELLRQVYESALIFYHKSEISMKGAGFNENIKKLHICISNSIKGDYSEKISKVDHDLIIIDEAHHVQANSYIRLIDKKIYNFPKVKILGLTATPDRVDGKFLEEILTKRSFKLQISDMIAQGHLCDIEGFNVKTNVDISEIDSHNRDFSLKLLYKKLNTEDRNNIILNICKKEMIERKTLIFCINVDHSKQINDLLNSNGLNSLHIDGGMKSNQRKSILDSFRNGDVSFLCNCQMLTEGFDEPSIDGIILGRPTRSRALFIQMIGRGLRNYPGKKNCKIIDIVDNHKNLSGFNSLICEESFVEIESFKKFEDIKDHVEKQRLTVKEFFVERANFFNINANFFCGIEATESMIKYLKENKIKYYHPIMFNEAGFLIFYNELLKEYNNDRRNSK